MHACGVVHRDIKPSNLFIRDGLLERVCLIDFGIARALDTTRSTEALVGTLGYLAPEQASAGAEVGPPADVFALGCVLFECLTGRTAFVSEEPLALLARILLEDPPPPSAIDERVPPELDALVARMLTKDPRRRPRASELLREVEALAPLLSRAGAPRAGHGGVDHRRGAGHPLRGAGRDGSGDAG